MTTTYFRKKIQSILTDNKYDREVGGFRTGKIDLRKIPKIATGSNRVFKRRIERKGKFYSVCLVVDISGSMMREYSGENKLGMAAQAAADMYKALKSNDVEVCIIAFNSVIEMVKDFGWDFDPEDVKQHLMQLPYIQGRLPHDPRMMIDNHKRGNMPVTEYDLQSNSRNLDEPAGENFDHLAVRDADTLLSERIGRKIMLVYSDGRPTGGSEYLLRHEVQRVMKKGDTTLLGLGIMDDSVEDYYPNVAVVDGIEEIYPTTINLLSKHIKRG